jgi:hypothetical protein
MRSGNVADVTATCADLTGVLGNARCRFHQASAERSRIPMHLKSSSLPRNPRHSSLS